MGQRRRRAPRLLRSMVRVAGLAAVWPDEPDDGTVVGGPDGQHPVAAVQVPAADVLGVFTGQPTATRRAALVCDLADDAQRSCPPRPRSARTYRSATSVSVTSTVASAPDPAAR